MGLFYKDANSIRTIVVKSDGYFLAPKDGWKEKEKTYYQIKRKGKLNYHFGFSMPPKFCKI